MDTANTSPNDTSALNRPLAVVTGASSGIGLELAAELARRGYDLVVAAEDDGIDRAAAGIAGQGGAARAVRADLATYDGVEQLYAAITADGRPVEVVAFNAGVGVHGDFARDTALRDELRLIDLNVRSAVHLAKRLLPAMVARGKGRALFTSSIAAGSPGPYEATYNASKAFLYSFAEAIRHELKDTGVTVTALLPGPTETEFFDRAGLQDTKLGQTKKDDAGEVAREGIEAMFAGKDHVVAGSARNKAQLGAGRVLTEPAKAAAHAKMSEPGSGKS
jgi:short-subunit dehydrogenase